MTNTIKHQLYGASLGELKTLCEELGLPRFAHKQIARWHFLNVLFDKALMCKEFADPECSGLNNEYGSGLITCHGTDFYVPDNLFMKDFMDYYHFQNLLILWKIDEYN